MARPSPVRRLRSAPLMWTCWGITALLLAACSTPTLIKGRVVDARGAPIAKAVIETTPPTDSVVTNSRGFFVLRQRLSSTGDPEPLPPGAYRVRVTKTGFEDLDRDVVARGGTVELAQLVLQPRTLDVGEAAPEALKDKPTLHDDTSPPMVGP